MQHNSRTLQIISLLLIPSFTFSQNFSWEKGENDNTGAGSYTTMGVTLPSNNPLGRAEAARWKDAEGNFWIFGGHRTMYSTSPHVLNDMLKFEPSTRNWTWMKGPFPDDNKPGVYGQQGVPAAQNMPGARSNAATWTDKAGNLWLFGGTGHAASGTPNLLSDLWKYDPKTNMWTWMKGSNQTFQLGTFGTQGVPDLANNPGCRHGAVTWTDEAGDLWLFGGYGRYASSGPKELSDFWRYNIASNSWTWMDGSTTSPFGVYTSVGANGRPGGRQNAGSWADTLGNLWLYGGYGWTNSYGVGYNYLSDIWRYNVSSGKWTWVKGSLYTDQPAVRGAKGVASGNYTPGGRWGFGFAGDPSGVFWIHGGRQTDGNALTDDYGDLWRYNPYNNTWAWVAGSSQYAVSTVYGTITVPDPANAPGARIESAAWCDDFGHVWILGGYGRALSQYYGFMNDLFRFGNCTGAFKIHSDRDTVCEGESVSLSVNHTGSLNWSTGQSTSTIVESPAVSTTYSVTLSDIYGCQLEVSHFITVDICASIAAFENRHGSVVVYPNPGNGWFLVNGLPAGEQSIRIFDAGGALVNSQVVSPEKNTLHLELTPGFYFYRIGDKTGSTGKLIIR
jgi:N-acetylneuraminic acid mutarotase